MRKQYRGNFVSALVGPLLIVSLAMIGCAGDDDDDGGGAPPATNTPVATTTTGPTDTPTVTAPTATPTSEPIPPSATPTSPLSTATVSATATRPAVAVLRRASKSSAVAVTDDNRFVVMCNPDDDSVSVFQIGASGAGSGQGTLEITRVAKITTGDEPVAVVVHPDNRTAFVANRGAATVVKISNLGPGAAMSASVGVDSEPTGLALSPTGATLFVAAFAEGTVSVLSSSTLTLITTITAPDNPRAVAVTNDGDSDDDDETLVVTEFYGVAGNETECQQRAGSPEACDLGRRGAVRLYNVADYSPQPPRLMFEPIDSGFAPPNGTETVMTSPNQLYAAAIQGGRVYVTSVSASPEPPINFQVNVAPVIYVGDLQTHQEVRSAGGSTNLARLAEDALGDTAGTDRFFLQELVDLDFAVGTQTAYAVSRAADAVQEVTFDSTSGTRIGLPQINLLQNVGAGPCQNPIGIAVAPDNGLATDLPLAFVNCWLTERLAVIDVTTKTLVTTVQSVLPSESNQPAAVRRGKRFYFTGRGRWSDEGEGYSSCASCHPDGLSDGITWSFAAGPRQTTAMDGSFSHGTGPQQQRIFNWTGIFDELHDFERNTRGVSGGLGAITTSPTGMCGTLSAEQQFPPPPTPFPADGLGQPVKEIQDDPANMICTRDWDDINEFVKTIRPPRRLRSLDPAAVERGRALFIGDGACTTCHAGPGWTISRRYWTPSSANNTALKAEPFFPPTSDAFWPLHSVQIGAQPAAADITGAVIPPNEVACVLRDVDTFGIPGDSTLTDLIERKADAMRTRAQGAGGFNVPSLYGMSVGAPYLHHGQVRTLQELFTDSRWSGHLQAGNPEFAPAPADVDDLISFILSIDRTTPEAQIPTPFDACPAVFPAAGTFRAELTGDQEVPDPVTTSAVGEATFVVSGDDDTIAFELTTVGLEPTQILQAHIHAAPPGMNGDIIAFLAYGSFPGHVRGTITASDLKIPNLAGIDSIAELIELMRQGNTYANVHTLSHGAGEIRGQIESPDFAAQLSGDQEVDPVTTEATGEALFFRSRDGSSLSYVLSFSNLAPAQTLQAHLHAAAAGVNGNVVVALVLAPFSSPLSGTIDAGDVIPDAVSGIDTFPELITAIEAGNVYVNVHTIAHPGGEIRGQLGAQE